MKGFGKQGPMSKLIDGSHAEDSLPPLDTFLLIAG